MPVTKSQAYGWITRLVCGWDGHIRSHLLKAGPRYQCPAGPREAWSLCNLAWPPAYGITQFDALTLFEAITGMAWMFPRAFKSRCRAAVLKAIQ